MPVGHLAATDDEEKLGELPPLDAEEEEGEGPEGDHLPEIGENLGEEAVDPDDEDTVDLDVGIDLGEEVASEEDRGEIVLDIAELLAFADEREGEDEPESFGPGSTLEDDIDSEDESTDLLGSSEEGVDEPLEDLVSDELPELDADEPGGFDDGFASEIVPSDDELPPRASALWSSSLIADAGVALSQVVLSADEVVTAGHGLSWLAAGAVIQAPLGGALVRSVAACADGTLLCATSSGELLRLSRSAPKPEPLPQALETLGIAGGHAHLLQCARFPEAGPRGLLAHSGSARIAVSADGGDSWRSLEVGGRIIATATGGAPTRLVARGHEEHALLSFERGGQTLSRVPLDDRAAEELLGHERPLLAASGSTVALASPDAELLLSRDGGKSFERIAGCQRATALSVGMRDGRMRVWLTLFQESLERAIVVEVDAETGRPECVVELKAQDESQDPRVNALGWNPETDELWAAGDSGLWCLRPRVEREARPELAGPPAP